MSGKNWRLLYDASCREGFSRGVRMRPSYQTSGSLPAVSAAYGERLQLPPSPLSAVIAGYATQPALLLCGDNRPSILLASQNRSPCCKPPECKSGSSVLHGEIALCRKGVLLYGTQGTSIRLHGLPATAARPTCENSQHSTAPSCTVHIIRDTVRSTARK